MTTDFSQLSIDELNKIQEDVQNLLASKKDAVKKDAKKKIHDIAKEAGLYVKVSDKPFDGEAEVEKGSSLKGTKVEPKYQNPDDPNTTWTGRGQPPGWMKELIAKGHTKEEFLIKKS